MPEAVMHIVFSQIDLRAQQNCRLVSKYWHQMINNNLKARFCAEVFNCDSAMILMLLMP